MKSNTLMAACAACLLCTGCATSLSGSATGQPARVVDPTRPTANSGIGIESQDIRRTADEMLRDLLAARVFSDASVAPRIIIDDTRFLNESNQTLNLSLLLDRLRIELMRAAGGRIQFVSRQNVDLVAEEKALKDAGNVDEGALDNRQMIAGADYRLIGRIASLSSFDPGTRLKSNYYQFSFEVLDLTNGLSVWGGVYDMKKEGANDRVYN